MTARTPAFLFLALLVCGVLDFGGTGAQAQPSGADYSGSCPNGAQVDQKYCRFFVYYNRGDSQISAIGADFLQVAHASETRSIGLVIEVDDYPLMQDKNLTAAAVDAMALQKFLIEDQRFDEVILLRNADATVDNINYFLETYLPNRGQDFHDDDGNPKARLLIAYSGHGRAKTPSVEAAFILGNADKPDGSTGVYKMANFAGDLKSLAPHYFHILTLINACFGANIFPDGPTGAGVDPSQPGAFIITAGSPLNEVQALLPPRGSLFFDLIINGIRNGEADRDSASYYVTSGDDASQKSDSLTLVLPLDAFLTGAFHRINTVQTSANPEFLTLSPPYLGPAQDGMAKGGFFFVSSKPDAAQFASSLAPYLTPLGANAHVEASGIGDGPGSAPPRAGSVSPPGRIGAGSTTAQGSSSAGKSPRPQIPFGPISSIKGHPEIKIFKAPAIYPIKGYDLSSADGAIDWNAFSQSQPAPTFIYARALGWQGRDGAFADRWTHARLLGLDRGAYIKFNFCRPVRDQVADYRAIVGADMGELPVALELVTPTADQARGAEQLACYKRHDAAYARDRIVEMADGLKALTGKIPLLIGNGYNLSVLTDARAERFMLWFNGYGPQDMIADKLKLRGNNPWTLWQYSGSLKVRGVGGSVTGEVFFGAWEQYAAFRRGATNVARSAVQ